MIWLVGSKGMLGTEVETLLEESGIQYVATDQDVDITEPDSIEKFLDSQIPLEIRWILNCAAYTAVDLAEDEHEMAFAVNAKGPYNLARVAQTRGAALVHISTDYVFNGEKQEDYTEEDVPCPVNTYGRSKLEGEIAVKGTCESYFIIRSAWMYGRNGKNFVDTMLRLFQERRKVHVVADQVGNPTYTHDLAQLLVALVSRQEHRYGTYHFTCEGRASWYDFARAICEESLLLGKLDHEVEIVPITTTEYPTKAERPQNSSLSKEKIKRELAIHVRGWREALREYLGGAQ